MAVGGDWGQEEGAECHDEKAGGSPPGLSISQHRHGEPAVPDYWPLMCDDYTYLCLPRIIYC